MYKEVTLSCLPERLVVSVPARLPLCAFDICVLAKHVQWHMWSHGIKIHLFSVFFFF